MIHEYIFPFDDISRRQSLVHGLLPTCCLPTKSIFEDPHVYHDNSMSEVADIVVPCANPSFTSIPQEQQPNHSTRSCRPPVWLHDYETAAHNSIATFGGLFSFFCWQHLLNS